MTLFKGVILASLAFGGLALNAGTASAVPMVDPGPAVLAHSEAVSGVEQTRWVCGPYGRCFWRPNYYGVGPGFYGYGFRGGPGWHGGWRGGGWHGGGWHGGGWHGGGHWHGGGGHWHRR